MQSCPILAKEAKGQPYLQEYDHQTVAQKKMTIKLLSIHPDASLTRYNYYMEFVLKTQVLLNHFKSNESHNTMPSGKHQQEVREMLLFKQMTKFVYFIWVMDIAFFT